MVLFMDTQTVMKKERSNESMLLMPHYRFTVAVQRIRLSHLKTQNAVIPKLIHTSRKSTENAM